MRMPFLFRLGEHELTQYVVKIATHDYVFYDSRWMCDEQLGDQCLIPDVDLCHEKHTFNNEADAIVFIARWWKDFGKYHL